MIPDHEAIYTIQFPHAAVIAFVQFPVNLVCLLCSNAI